MYNLMNTPSLLTELIKIGENAGLDKHVRTFKFEQIQKGEKCVQTTTNKKASYKEGFSKN